MSHVAPGVYTKIFDLSQYIQAVPSTIGMICSLTEKGEDNILKFFSSRADYIAECGEPNITRFGKNYGQGPYCAYNFLGESGALYHIRCMADDATFSNLMISAVLAPTDSTASIVVSYIDSANTIPEIKTALQTAGYTYPLGVLRPIGRGEYYNSLSVRFVQHSNPLLNGIYILDIYELQSDGNDVIVESFEVSFDPAAQSLQGDSIWIEYILLTYSNLLRWESIKTDGNYAEGFDYLAKPYDKNIGVVTADVNSATASIKDIKQDFSDWQTNPQSGNATYMVVAKDAKGIKIWGWLGSAISPDHEQINVFRGRNLTTSGRGWKGNLSMFNPNSLVTYQIQKTDTDISSAFISGDSVPLKRGNDGSLRNSDGSLNNTVATHLLAQGYTGGELIDPIKGTPHYEDKVLDTEFVYFNMVFDCGYPHDVKVAISTMVQTRTDCVALLDNGDNASYSSCIDARQNINVFNNYYCALYEEYNKVYDSFTGQSIWVSPIYHMSYLAPRNDNVSEIWYAIAGFNRTSISSISELRFNPKLGQRDQMYLSQINPIVHFAQGYAPFSQLTTQSQASAMQDLNIVRLVLYIKKAFEGFCKFYIFEQNDAFTWGQVSNQMVPFLEDIKNRRGLYGYSVDVGATDYEKKTKQFHCNVSLNPTRVVERINLNFFIQ